MIPAAFDYVAPESVADALAALADSEDAKVLAGGQSLLPILRMRLNAPERVVDLGHIPQLQGVHEDGDDIVIGAMTSYADLLAEPLVAEHAPGVPLQLLDGRSHAALAAGSAETAKAAAPAKSSCRRACRPTSA